MTVAEFLDELDTWWLREHMSAIESKSPDSMGGELGRLYRQLSDKEQRLAHVAFIAWALSEDEAKRFDGLHMVDSLGIVEAIPSLRVLAQRFEQGDGPSAPYDWAKVNRILGRLTSAEVASGEPS